jgi:hypothetical protein
MSFRYVADGASAQSSTAGRQTRMPCVRRLSICKKIVTALAHINAAGSTLS